MIDYEWDVEEMKGEDIEDHTFCDSYAECLGIAEGDDRIVLVCSWGSEHEGVTDRAWAYVIDSKLPEQFTDSRGCELRAVPQRFHQEVKA